MNSEGTMTTRIDRSSMVVGVLFLIAGVVLAVVGMGSTGNDPNALAHGYLFGWVFWACLTFGCFGLSLLHHCARGHWGFPVLRLFEAGGGPINLALFGLLLLPVTLMWKPVFFPWARPEEVQHDVVLQHRAGYFALFDVRLVLYFALMVVLAVLNKNWQKQEDATGDEKWWKKRQFFGGIFIVLFICVMNFLWTDILMSQYPKWYSTIYGVWFVVGSCLMAFSFCAIILGTQAKKKPYSSVVEPWLTKDIGNWMLTFTMLWAYFSFSQYLIYWSGNLEELTSFFIDRSKEGWQVHGTSLILLHFFLPFTLLLAPRTKRVPLILAGVGLYILFARFLDLMYIVLPTWRVSWGISPLDLGMFFAFGGVWLLTFGVQVRQAPLLPKWLPRMKEATDHV